MSTKARILAVLACLGAGPALAQQGDGVGTPLSAIDWLSDTVVETLPRPTAPVLQGVETETIQTAPLDSLVIDAAGLFPASVTGLPPRFWGPTPVADLVALLGSQSLDLPDPARTLFFRLLLAELDPPVDAGPEHLFFLARIDALLRFGALDAAQALLERAGPADPTLFRRWFDVSLLMGSTDRACAVMRAAPDIAPTFSARVFCLARGNDWSAAALSLDTARALGVLSEADDALLARFLDPELYEGQPMAPLPQPLTPLGYRMLLALGEAPAGSGLPLAFSHALLDPVAGWKPRLEAAERLARVGGLAETQLFALYTERQAAASGGVWERVAAVQAVDAALLGGDTVALWRDLPRAAEELRAVGLEGAFARQYGPKLAEITPPPNLRALRDRLIALSGLAEASADSIDDPFLAGLARGLPPAPARATPLTLGIVAAFEGRNTALAPALEQLLAEGRLGEASLQALRRLGAARPDPGDVEVGLKLLLRLGFESTARATAIALYTDALTSPG